MPLKILDKRKIIPLLPGLFFNPLSTLEKIDRKYGDIVLIRLTTNEKILLVNEPEFIKHILITNEKNYLRTKALPKLGEYLGNGLLNALPEDWEFQRKLLNPNFTEESVQKLKTQVEKTTYSYIGLIRKNFLNSSFDLGQGMKDLFLKVMCDILFVQNAHYPLFEISNLGEQINELASFKEQKLTQFYAQFSETYKQKRDKQFENLILRQRSNAEKIIEIAENSPTDIQPFLANLISAQKKGLMTYETVRDQIINMFFAGFDTISSAMTWLIFRLSIDNSLQIYLRNEVLKNNNPELLESAIKEALRLYPPSWSFPRYAVEDDDFNGIHIPKGIHILISPYLIHRSPKYWKSPDEFRVDRFIGFKPNPSTVFIPFGFGKHTCIGKRLAMLEMKIVLPMLLECFEFTAERTREPKIVPGIIIKPRKPIKVRIRELN